MSPIIKVEQLHKNFLVRRSFPGIRGALKGLFSKSAFEFKAIDNISFSINPGERVAFIGPNGAGKSTTIKMLTGILYPTSGSIEVLGLTPWKDRKALGYQIGTVFGQNSQLWHHLPPSDTFDLLAKIYELDNAFYQKQLNDLTKLFKIENLLEKPVRGLSLGERMRCEIVASLLHNPKILFLDEPTIGLDINAKLIIRNLLNHLSIEFGTTLFLTSHDTADIEHVCDRVIVISKGSIILDNSLRELKKTHLKKKIVTLTTDSETLSLNLPNIQILENKNFHFSCEVNLNETSIEKLIHEASKVTGLRDVTIEDPSMEEIIRAIYG